MGLLFADIELPGGMDGLGLAEEVHGVRPDVDMVAADAISEVGVKVLEASDAGEALTFSASIPKWVSCSPT